MQAYATAALDGRRFSCLLTSGFGTLGGEMVKTSLILVVALAAFTTSSGGASAAGCQKGVASAPYIGSADMRAIDRAVARLPAVRPGKVHVSVGLPVPGGLARKAVPVAVTKILPQYKAQGYTAFRTGQRLAIVNPRGVLAYVMPIGAPTTPGNCP